MRGDPGQARLCHQQALDLAREIGIAWDEAHALAGLARCAPAAGQPEQAAGLLRQALEIFRRIGAAEAAGIAAELDALAGAPDQAARAQTAAQRTRGRGPRHEPSDDNPHAIIQGRK